MVNTQLIDSVKSKLIEAYHPHAIYIFGPYAWGSTNNSYEDPDLDILVVVNKLTNTRHRMIVKGRLALAYLPLSKDLTLYSKKEFDELAEDEMTLCYRITHEGRKIYAKA